MKKIGTEIKGLFILYTLVFILLAAVFTQLYGYVIEDNVLNQQIRTEARFLGQQLKKSGDMPAPRYPFMELIKDWHSLPKSIQSMRADSPERIEFITPEGKNVHIIEITPCKEHCLLMAYVDEFTFANRIWFVSAGGMLSIGLVLALICAFAIFRILGRITAPVRRLEKQVEKDAAELQFSDEFIATMPDNEIGFLAKTIAAQWQKMKDMLEREKHFTRDISHELRTPLSVIQNQVSQWDNNSQIDTQLTRRQLNKITQTLDVLTALARAESQQMSEVPVLQTIEEVTLALAQQNMPEDFDLVLNISGNFTLFCNPHLFGLLVKNLIENACKHGSGNELFISTQHQSLTFCNAFSQSLPDKPVKHGVKGESSRGMGQGLSLVKRIVDFHHGQLLITTRQDNRQRYFVVNVDLSPSTH